MGKFSSGSRSLGGSKTNQPHRPPSSQLLLREAAAVVVVHSVPALRVAVGPVLGVAAGLVAESLGPAFRVAHGHHLRAWRVAALRARRPTLAGLPTAVPRPEPALLLALLGSPDPELALGQREADLGAAVDLARDELVRAHAVVEEATDCRAVALQVGEQGLPRVSNHRVLLLAPGPVRRHAPGRAERPEERRPEPGHSLRRSRNCPR